MIFEHKQSSMKYNHNSAQQTVQTNRRTSQQHLEQTHSTFIPPRTQRTTQEVCICDFTSKGKLHFLGECCRFIQNLDVRQKQRYLSLLCVFSKSLDICLHKQFCMFNGSDRETPLPLSKASTTHPKICNMLHLHVVTVHIHHAGETLSLWQQIQRNYLSRRSDTVWLCSENDENSIFSYCGECANNCDGGAVSLHPDK